MVNINMDIVLIDYSKCKPHFQNNTSKDSFSLQNDENRPNLNKL